MRIGIDLDEVTINMIDPLLTFYYQRTGIRIKRDDFHSFNFWEVWGGTREEAIKIYYEFYESRHFDTMPPIKDAISSINNLKEKYQIHFITSRPEEHKEKTDKWINTNFRGSDFPVVYTSDFYGETGKTKLEVCSERGIGTIIEDNGKYAMECAKNGLSVFLFDRPWNQKVEHDSLIRVEGWKEAMQHF